MGYLFGKEEIYYVYECKVYIMHFGQQHPSSREMLRNEMVISLNYLEYSFKKHGFEIGTQHSSHIIFLLKLN